MTEESSTLSKVSHTPGWNDPPVFAYESHQSQVKGYSLNKRVSYSQDSESQTQERLISSEKPSPQVGPPRASSLPNKSELVELKDKPANKPAELSSVLNHFHQTLSEVYTEDNEKETSEIKRRLSIMENMWNSDKFPEAVKQKLCDISEALCENKFETCDSLQRSLMVDHTSLCSSWMAAVRLLINSKRSLVQ